MKTMSAETTTRRLAAVREISIIVLGVLIALGAESAWSSREDRARARDHLAALAADLDETASRLDLAIEEDGASRERARRMYGILSGFEDVPVDSLYSLSGVGYSEFSLEVMLERYRTLYAALSTSR